MKHKTNKIITIILCIGILICLLFSLIFPKLAMIFTISACAFDAFIVGLLIGEPSEKGKKD